MIPALWHGGAVLARPALRLMLRRRVAQGKEIAARLPEREGIERAPRPQGQLLWLHCASVGEAVSVLPVLSCLATQPAPPWVLLTTGTVTSARLLAERLPALGLGRVLHRFVPLDVPGWAARFLDHWRPDAAGFVESELWPNLLAACQSRCIPMMLVNARMSERSFRGWQRVPGFARSMLGAFARVHPQSEDYGRRLQALGAGRMETPGNLKFAAPALPVDAAELERLRATIAGRPVWLAASTHPGEEALAGEVHRALSVSHPGLLTIVAPRHPGRGAEVAAVLGGVPRRSCGQGPDAGIWVADTMGELGLLYRLAPLVFMGRSLVGQGGQNPLEAARLGCAIVTGPHTGNFTAVFDTLKAAGAVAQVPDTAALRSWLDAMLHDPARRAAAGAAALSVANGEAGLPGRIAGVLRELMDGRAGPA